MVWLDGKPRATRFPIKTSLVFRENGDSNWHQAWTLNLSRTGVLFQTNGPLPIMGRTVEFIVALPMDDLEPALEVRCKGHIVRIAPEAVPEARPAVAVTIDCHAFDARQLA